MERSSGRIKCTANSVNETKFGRYSSDSNDDEEGDSPGIHNKSYIQKVHGELRDINEKLQHEKCQLESWSEKLEGREAHLEKVEKKLSAYAASLQDAIEKEVNARCNDLEKSYEGKLQQMQEEAKRTRNSIKVMKTSNEKLKKEIAEHEIKMKRYEDRNVSSQSRISNLQRKIEILTQQLNEQTVGNGSCQKEKQKEASRPVKNGITFQNSIEIFDGFAGLLEWISISYLNQKVDEMLQNRMKTSIRDDNDATAVTNERILKIIMFIPNVLSQISSLSSKIQSSFVQFLCSALLHMHLSQFSQRLSHSATYNRIGKVLYQDHPAKTGKAINSFFKCPDYSVRILSSLIILHCVNQADIVALVFQSLCNELKGELSKEFFLHHHGTEMLLPLFKVTNKTHLTYITDILMVLAVDSPYMSQLLRDIGNIEWIERILTVLKTSHDITLLENLSLLLQRLSKVKSMKPLFDALQVKGNVTDLMKHPNCEGEYLQLNLRSILLNIESMKSGK